MRPSIEPPSFASIRCVMSAELAVVYAALILQDDNVEITSDKLQTLVKAAGIEVEPVWFSLYAKALAGQDLKALLLNVGAPGAGGAAAATGAAGAAASTEAAVEEAVEEKEESDDDMGFGK
ncbi:60S acidic ribosomal protein P1 [Phycomyces blakesleeanus]